MSDVNDKTTDTREPLSTSSEWSFELLEDYDREIRRIAKDFRLDTYPNQIEVITTEQMMDAYSSVGMPLGYNHWSFGKQFLSVEQHTVQPCAHYAVYATCHTNRNLT